MRRGGRVAARTVRAKGLPSPHRLPHDDASSPGRGTEAILFCRQISVADNWSKAISQSALFRCDGDSVMGSKLPSSSTAKAILWT